ncbi:hypothetical protein TRFO_23600 [Tritrichomonas foetus]|uniref:Leucine Rich Repeat family protein n=1 Tax=Tritrichomonas foetus TaxID=1144522 RepID=A0A1J4KA06_9EUKA|nr:hypothetical protein TRFO_23600 [Tritrichomonas foetus]|eukprot:OHT08059.1 hypothetical protein TRFO_23600 [Tritrichomonas foetus]
MELSDQFLCVIPASEKIIEYCWLQQILPKGEHRKVFLIVTEFNIHLFLDSTDQPNLLACHPYKFLTGLDYIDEVTFRINFGSFGIYTFVDTKPSKILETIYEAASQTLPASKYPKFNRKIQINVKPNINQLLEQRYRAHLAWKHIFPTQFSLQRLRQYIKTKPIIIDLGIVEDLGIDVLTFLESTDVQPLFQTIVIPTRQNTSFYDILEKFIPFYSNISSLIINEPIDQGVFHFLNHMTQFPTISIKKIQFNNCLITPNLIESLTLFFQKHKVAFHLVNCEVLQSEQQLYSIIQSTTNLNEFSASSVWFNENFKLQSAHNLTSLSLRGCCIYIHDLLSTLSEKTPFLEYLDLSRNVCTRDFSSLVSLPPKLTQIYLNQVQWTPSNFYYVFKAACSLETSLTLSMASGYFLQRKNAFEEFYSMFDMGESNLYAFYWNNNSIRSVLLMFLMRCQNLMFLSIAGCKIKRHVSKTLHRLIEGHKTLMTVDLHGTQKATYTAFLPKFFSWMKKSRNIRRLDISKNSLDALCLSRLAELVTINTKLKQLMITDLDIDDYSSFQPLVEALKERKHVIYVKFPENDLKKLKDKGLITNELINEIRYLFRPPVSPPDQDCYEQWKKLIDQEYQEWPKIDLAKKPITIDAVKFETIDTIENSLSSRNRKFLNENMKLDLFDIPKMTDDDIIVIKEFEQNHSIEALRKNLELSLQCYSTYL